MRAIPHTSIDAETGNGSAISTMLVRSHLVSSVSTLLFVGIFAATTDVKPGDEGDGANGAESIQDRTVELPSDRRHTLWIPSDYQHRLKQQRRGEQVDVLFDFHSSPRLVRSNARIAGLNCVVISVKYSGLSSAYRVPFSNDRQLFATILDEALSALRAEPDFPENTEWGRLAITSFSAGFGAVREVLKTADEFDRIDAIFMVDSLYCGYVGDGTDRVKEGVVHPELMKDYLRFAQLSAAGKKVMIITHCVGPTPGYASTRETADYLLEKLELKPQSIDIVLKLPGKADDESGVLRLYRKAMRNGFSMVGSLGPSETDHVEHLRHMAYWLPGLPLKKREPMP